jgi:hypothetical protein
MQEIAQISGRLLGQQIRVGTIPVGLINTAAAVVGRFNPMVKDQDAIDALVPDRTFQARSLLDDIPPNAGPFPASERHNRFRLWKLSLHDR